MGAWLIAPGGLIILALIVIIRLMISMQRHINDHAERIAHLEGKLNGR